MGITSLNWFRRNHFELFYFAHISLAVPGFVFAFLHMPALARYLAPALLLYLLDLAFRYYRGTRLPSRLLIMKAFSEARVTALTISKQASSSDVPFEYLPGQYVFLQCPFLSKLENHPFSISSPPELKSGPASCTESIFTLHIRDMGPGTFSNQLLALALQRQTESRGQSLDASSATLSRSSLPNVTTSEATGSESVTIDGPYGSPAVELGDYDTLILVCGGIGITPALSWLAFLASSGPHDYQNDKAVVSQSSFCRKVFAWASSGMTDIPSRLQQILATNRRVALLWSIPDLSLVPVFASQLKAVHEYIERHQHQYRHVSMSIHVTRVPDLDSELKQNDAIPSQLHPYLVKQRPNHSVAFQSFQSVGNQQCASACVFACGPEALVNESRAAADAFGYDFHSEVFLF
jgi:ferredoxin-NADP reductase